MIPKNDREAISLIIDGLIERGCVPTMVRDGASEDHPYNTKEDALDNLTSCDESVLFVDLPVRTEDEEKELRALEAEFDASGGRGVDTAERIDFLRNKGMSSHIYFVLGNEPREVACDYGVRCDPYLSPVMDPWWK